MPNKGQRTFELVITPDFNDRWEEAKKAAKAAGISTSEWVRRACTAQLAAK
jgi:hypothetical protein